MYTVTDYINWIAQVSSLPTTGEEGDLILARLNDAYVEFVADSHGVTKRETVEIPAGQTIISLIDDFELSDVKEIISITDTAGNSWRQITSRDQNELDLGYRTVTRGNGYMMPGGNELYLARAMDEDTDVVLTYVSGMPLELVRAVTSAVAAANERQRLRSTPTTGITIVSGTTFTVAMATGSDTSALTAASSAAAVETALEALPGVGSGNVDVTGTIGSGGIDLTIEFKSALAATNIAQMIVVINQLRYKIATPDTTASIFSTHVAGQNHIVRLQATGASITTGDTWIPLVGATPMVAVDYDCTAGELETSLEAIFGSGNVEVTAVGTDITDGYDVELVGDLAESPFVTVISISEDSDLTGAWDDDSTVVQTGILPIDEVQTLAFSLPAIPTGGTFTISLPRGAGTVTTAAIAYNATSAAIAAAIEATAITGTVTVSGPITGLSMQIRIEDEGLIGAITADTELLEYPLSLAFSTIENGTPIVAGGVDVAETTMSSIPRRYHYDGVCNLALAKVFEYDQVDLKRALHHRSLAEIAKRRLRVEDALRGGKSPRIRKGLDLSW